MNRFPNKAFKEDYEELWSSASPKDEGQGVPICSVIGLMMRYKRPILTKLKYNTLCQPLNCDPKERCKANVRVFKQI